MPPTNIKKMTSLYERIKGMNFYDLVNSVHKQLTKITSKNSARDNLPKGIFDTKYIFGLLVQTAKFRPRTFENYEATHKDEAELALSHLEMAVNNFGVILPSR